MSSLPRVEGIKNIVDGNSNYLLLLRAILYGQDFKGHCREMTYKNSAIPCCYQLEWELVPVLNTTYQYVLHAYT